MIDQSKMEQVREFGELFEQYSRNKIMAYFLSSGDLLIGMVAEEQADQDCITKVLLIKHATAIFPMESNLAVPGQQVANMTPFAMPTNIKVPINRFFVNTKAVVGSAVLNSTEPLFGHYLGVIVRSEFEKRMKKEEKEPSRIIHP